MKRGVMVIPQGKSDPNGRLTHMLESGEGISEETFITTKARLLVQYPFFMGMARQDFFDIGGYDEDFVGVGAEDRDLVERLKGHGCKYHQEPDAQIVHLCHRRSRSDRGLNDGIENRLQYNRDLFHRRRGQVVRNEGREWGVL